MKSDVVLGHFLFVLDIWEVRSNGSSETPQKHFKKNMSINFSQKYCFVKIQYFPGRPYTHEKLYIDYLRHFLFFSCHPLNPQKPATRAGGQWANNKQHPIGLPELPDTPGQWQKNATQTSRRGAPAQAQAGSRHFPGPPTADGR
jgi:hypothetical protein